MPEKSNGPGAAYECDLLRGEVEWLLPEGPQLYWRGRLVEVAYELAEPS